MFKWLAKIALPDFNERSTWRGIIGFLTLFGIGLSPEQADAIAGVGAAVYFFVQVFFKDKKPAPVPTSTTPPLQNDSAPLTEPDKEKWTGKNPSQFI